MKRLFIILFFISSMNCPFEACANQKIQSFYEAKNILEEIIYKQVSAQTLYCEYEFSQQTKIIQLPENFYIKNNAKYTDKIEWEHVVPVENFGRTFEEWRTGNPLCIDKEGVSYKGRRCAEKANKEFRLMVADMYNLYPTVGVVGALRSNYDFIQFPDNIPSSFGDCEMKIYERKAEPPDNVKGLVARVYLYMEQQYPRFKMSKSQRKLMDKWNKQYPVTKEECLRTKLIEEIQGNENSIVKELCLHNNLW